jgi:hypothetical protein
MRQFVNNFKRTMVDNLYQNNENFTSVADAEAVEALLPTVGDWGLFTLSKPGSTVVEIVKITRANATAPFWYSPPKLLIEKGQEGTTDQDWLLPYFLSMRVTAGTLSGFDQSISGMLDSILLDQDGNILTDGETILTL